MPLWAARVVAALLFTAIMAKMTAMADPIVILARCGPSKGQSYYFEAGMVGPGQGGWRDDGFDDGRITAYLNDKKELDIVLRDTTGTRSYLKSGYRVILNNMSKEDHSFMITAFGEGFVETFIFKTNDFGVGTVAWTSAKVQPLFTKSSIMSADCGPKYALTP